MTRILVMGPSLRAGSSSAALARALVARLPEGVVAEMADIGALPHYNGDSDGGPAVARLIAQVAVAEGVLFVSPEYNYSVPGVLKNAIDWASRPSYQSGFKGKSCFVITSSAGAMGGVRAQGHLKLILGAMLAEVFPWPEVVVPEATKKLVDGVFADAAVLEFAGAALAAWLARLRDQKA